jgi:hypothetical protein
MGYRPSYHDVAGPIADRLGWSRRTLLIVGFHTSRTDAGRNNHEIVTKQLSQRKKFARRANDSLASGASSQLSHAQRLVCNLVRYANLVKIIVAQAGQYRYSQQIHTIG